jgi:hypothetical protein
LFLCCFVLRCTDDTSRSMLLNMQSIPLLGLQLTGRCPGFLSVTDAVAHMLWSLSLSTLCVWNWGRGRWVLKPPKPGASPFPKTLQDPPRPLISGNDPHAFMSPFQRFLISRCWPAPCQTTRVRFDSAALLQPHKEPSSKLGYQIIQPPIPCYR